MSLRRVAAAQNAVHPCLALGNAAVTNQSHSQDIVQRRLVRM